MYSDVSCNILRASYLHYFSDLAPMGPHNAAVVSSGGRVTLLVQPVWDVGRARRRWCTQASLSGTATLTH